MEFQKTIVVHTETFFHYLIDVGLFRLKLEEDKTTQEFKAIVSKINDEQKTWFTQCLVQPDKSVLVRLSKKDVFNDKITRGYFNNRISLKKTR